MLSVEPSATGIGLRVVYTSFFEEGLPRLEEVSKTWTMYWRCKFCRRPGNTVRLITLAALTVSLLSLLMSFSDKKNKLTYDQSLLAMDPVENVNGEVSITKWPTQSLLSLAVKRKESTFKTKPEFSITEVPTLSLVNLAGEKTESRKPATIHEILNTKLPTESLVTLAEQGADSWLKLTSKRRTLSACLDKEMIMSEKINKLGAYAQDKRFLTIGISSVTRPSGKSYLVKTIRLLLDSLSQEHRKEVFMVIFLADFDETHKYNSLRILSTEFQKFIDQSLLHVIFAPRDYYPPLSNLKTKYGDSQERISWRSKLVVDFSFIMCYCKDLSQYYLHLEDDLMPSPSFYPKLRDFIASQKQPWAMLDAAYMGHTAKVYHSSDLENVAAYFYLLYDEMPVDWLMMFWRHIKYHDKFVLPAASLFQHVGHNSSLVENKRSYKSKEIYFDEYDIKYRGLNPAAIVSSSMDSEEGTKPEHAYNKGAGYFWAKGVTKDKVILFKFINSIALLEVFVETGSYLAPKDKLKSGVLQASFEIENGEVEENGAQVCKDFEAIGSFKDGRVKVALNEKRKLSCLRILVTEDQEEWLFLREVDVWQN